MKQRLSDFFVKEDGHVAHKNALVAGTVATGGILTVLMLTPDSVASYQCGRVICANHEYCCQSENDFFCSNDPKC